MFQLKSLIIISLVFLSGRCIAQEYNFLHYGVQDGLPQSQAYDIYQDHHSYIWIATQGGGVGRFDGINFDALTSRNGLPSNYVNTIYGDDEDDILFGTKAGLAIYRGDNIVHAIPTEVGINHIIEKNDSVCWIATDRGLYEHNQRDLMLTKAKIDSRIDVLTINCMVSIDQYFWIATSNGLYRMDEQRDVERIAQEELLSQDIKSIAVGRNQQLWIAQYGGGVSSLSLQDLAITSEHSDRDLQRGQSISMIRDEVWLSTQNAGIQIYAPARDQWTQISERHGLSHNNIRAITTDQSDNIWIASSGGGISKYLGQYFTHYTSANGLNGNRIYAIAPTSDRGLMLSVDTDGVSAIDSGGISTDIDSTYIETKCTDIYEDSSGRLWLSTAGGGLVMHDTSGYRQLNTENGLSSDWIRSVRQDGNGDLWVGTYADGLAKILFLDSIGVQVEEFKRRQGVADLRITVLAVSPLGDLWYASRNGSIGHIRNDKIVNFDESNGLPKTEVRTITFDSLQNIWIGTAGKGMYKAQYQELEPTFEVVAENEQLASENIYSMLIDDDANLWVGTEKGIDKILLNESGTITEVQNFGKNEGFVGIETCHNSVAKDREGNLWFGTLNGLTKHTPDNRKLSVSNPQLHFEDILIKNKPHGSYAEGSFEVEAGVSNRHLYKHFENDFNFKFRAINIDHPKGIVYSWRLSGLNDEWSEWNSSTAVNYYSLAPGEYTFEAKAKGTRGTESNLINHQFEINTALWQRTWFKLLVIGLLGLLAIWIIRNRIKSIRSKEEEKRRQLQLQNELLTLEQKALQLQMNPHFIFNALNSIQGLIVTNKNEVARDQIQNFAALMRGILTNSKKDSTTLAEERATLEKYLELEQFCQSNPFEYSIELPADVDPDEIEIPPMIVQPFVENAVIHGVSHLSSLGNISIKFSLTKEHLRCTIIDNGIGRAKAATLKLKNQKKDHESMAVQIATDRLNSLHKSKNEYITINDLVDPIGKAIGTEVILLIPYEHTY